jgi:hypothetical protein
VIEGAWQASCPGDIEAAVERIIAAIQEAEVRLRSILGSIGAIKGTTVLSERHVWAKDELGIWIDQQEGRVNLN